MRPQKPTARRAAALVILAVLPFGGCGFFKGVGKVTVGAAKTTGKVVTYPFKTMANKNGAKNAATAPVVGSSGIPVENGTVIVGANSSEDAKTTKAVASTSTSRATKSYGGSEIYIDGIPIDSPSIMASQPTTSSSRR